MKVPKALRNSIFSVVVLISLFIGGGMAYALFAGGSEPEEQAAKPADTTPAYQPLKKPPPPPANASVGVALGAITSPAKAGTNASLSVRTTATAKCAPTVTYAGVPSKDSGLMPKAADAYGIASWTWTVEAAAPVGEWPARVTCGYNGRTAVLEVKFQVVK